MPSPPAGVMPALWRFRLSGAIILLSVMVLAGCTQSFEATPEISSVTPNPAKVGATVTIKGKNLPTDSPPKVSIGGKDAPVLSYFDTKITVRVPEGSESGGITVDIGGVLLDADLTVGATAGDGGGGGTVNLGGGAALEPYFQVPLEGLKIDQGSSGTVEASELFDPKDAKDAFDAAQQGGFAGGYVATYKSHDIPYVSMIGVQMSTDQAALEMYQAYQKFAEDPYKKGYEVQQASGQLSDGTMYSGFNVPISTTDDLTFLAAAKGPAVFSIRLVGPPKSADEAQAAKWLDTVVSSASF